ncbi:MAG: inorganic phosphate transporter [Chloroflexi bacterium]|nr:MAG: inorganic phosphate transporter [Chloroflexota bacterium]
MLLPFVYLGSIFMGWSLGANDAANIFGTGVVTRAIRFRTAAILLSVFVILGSTIEGQKTIETVGFFTELNISLALLATIAAALVVTGMTYFGIPVSTSQAILGAVMGVAIYTTGFAAFPWDKFTKVIICWVGAPLGAMVISIALYQLMDIATRRIKSLPTFMLAMKIGIMVVGSYGAYTLGANNVANTTGVFVGAGVFTPFLGTVIGGLAIALGACTYSKRVMETVGGKITPLDIPTAFVAVLAEAITLHIFTQVGVPVSASQAIVGAVIGIGMAKGIRTVSAKKTAQILVGWVLTLGISILLPYLFLLLFSW